MSTPLRERPDAPLGTLIFRAGLLPAETIESALEEGVKTGKRLGEILTERGLISEVDLARLLAGQKGLEFVTLREQIVDPSAASLFTEEQARLFRALPYSFDGELPVVAIADPTDEVLMRNIREALGRDDARFVVSARGELAEIAADVFSRPLTPAASPEPAAEPGPAPDVPAEPEPDVAAHGEHANGSAPADPELILQAPAYEPTADPAPEPEPVPVAPEPSAFQIPAVEEPAAPEPVAAPEPEPPVAYEPPPAPEPAYEPTPVAPEPPMAFETQAPPQPLAAPEPLITPEPLAAPEPPLHVEPPVARPPAAAPASDPEPVASSEPVPLPLPEPPLPSMPYPPAASHPEAPAEPTTTPAPVAEAPPEVPVEAPEPTATIPWRLTIRLTTGERVDAGDFPDQDSAKQEAKAIMIQIADADSDEWPFVNGRFLKPDTIVSVDIAELAGDES